MPTSSTPEILIVGGAHIDRIGRSHARLEPGQSNPGSMKKTIGGVAGNIAQALARLDHSVVISSILGQDDDAEWVKSTLKAGGVDISGLCHDDKKPTASYTAVEDKDGSLIAAIADMAIYDAYPKAKFEDCIAALPQTARILVDTNISEAALETIAAQKGERHLSICAVSGPKANRASTILHATDLLFCNEAEAAILAQEFAELDALPEILLEMGVKKGVITKGNAGVLVWNGDKVSEFPAPPIKVVSSNGAGDCLCACTHHALLMGNELQDAIPYGLAGASLALMSEQAVPDMLNRPMLQACLAEIPS